MAHTHKLVDGVRVALTADEITQLNANDTTWKNDSLITRQIRAPNRSKGNESRPLNTIRRRRHNSKVKELKTMMSLCDESFKILITANDPLEYFGKMLGEQWIKILCGEKWCQITAV